MSEVCPKSEKGMDVTEKYITTDKAGRFGAKFVLIP
jgi:hypothetical protein